MDLLTEGEISLARDAFSLYDQGRKGSIPASKVTNVIRSVGFSVTMDEITAFVKTSDKINFPDICEFIGHCKERGNGMNEILEAFRASDTAKTGEMETDLLKYYLRSIGEKLSDAEIDSYVRPFDKGGKIKYEEFVNSLFR